MKVEFKHIHRILPGLLRANSLWPVIVAVVVVQMILLALRIHGSMSWTEPLALMTSGREEEALFGIWKAMHSVTLYAIWDEPPFAASYYNWLFYYLYAWMASGVMALLGLGDEWLPGVTHGITLALIPLLVWCLRRLFSGMVPGMGACRALCFACAVASTPLMGWWLLAARSDVGALLLESLAFLLLLSYTHRPALKKLVGVVLLCWAAWSFRQISVHVIGALCLYVLFARQHRTWLWIVVATFGFFAITIMLLGPGYRSNIFQANMAWPFSWKIGFQNLCSACVKAPMLPFGCLFLPRHLRQFRALTAERRCLCLAVCWSLLWDVFCACKMAASDNYFFFSAVVCSLFLWQNTYVPLSAKQGPGKTALLLALAVICQLLTALLPVLGLRGTTSLLSGEQSLQQVREVISRAHVPVFASRPEWNLPWVNPSRPSSVYTALIDETYQGEVVSPRVYAAMQKWLRSRTFATFLIDSKHPGPLSDPTLLQGYHLVRQLGTWSLYERSENEAP